MKPAPGAGKEKLPAESAGTESAATAMVLLAELERAGQADPATLVLRAVRWRPWAWLGIGALASAFVLPSWILADARTMLPLWFAVLGVFPACSVRAVAEYLEGEVGPEARGVPGTDALFRQALFVGGAVFTAALAGFALLGDGVLGSLVAFFLVFAVWPQAMAAVGFEGAGPGEALRAGVGRALDLMTRPLHLLRRVVWPAGKVGVVVLVGGFAYSVGVEVLLAPLGWLRHLRGESPVEVVLKLLCWTPVFAGVAVWTGTVLLAVTRDRVVERLAARERAGRAALTAG